MSNRILVFNTKAKSQVDTSARVLVELNKQQTWEWTVDTTTSPSGLSIASAEYLSQVIKALKDALEQAESQAALTMRNP